MGLDVTILDGVGELGLRVAPLTSSIKSDGSMTLLAADSNSAIVSTWALMVSIYWIPYRRRKTGSNDCDAICH